MKNVEPGILTDDNIHVPSSISEEEEQLSNREENRYLEELKVGKYLGVLETYVSDEKWSLERVARDIWQNFFDANGGTLDGVDVEHKEDNGKIVISIKGDAEYDFRRLLHFGSGSKTGSQTTAGKHSEGTRIYALHMLRDYGFSKVQFSSGKWEMEFYLDQAPGYEIPEEMKDTKGLFVRLNFIQEDLDGNRVDLVTSNPENFDAIEKARDLFYHSENSDFLHPDIDTDKGGLKIHFGQRGNLYINGQRIHYESQDSWMTLSDMSIWSKETPHFQDRTLKMGRDRSMVTSGELCSIVIPFVVESMSLEECQMLLSVIEPSFNVDVNITVEQEKLLNLLIDKLAMEDLKVDFPKNMIAEDDSSIPKDTLINLGYIVCRSSLYKIGMRKASEKWAEIMDVHSVEMSELETQRAELIHKYMAEFLDESNLDPRIIARPIAVFSGKHPYLSGKYEGKVVFISQYNMQYGDLARVLATYKHEICHSMGSDDSSEFTYAYTNLDEAWTRYIIKNPEQLRALEREFKDIGDSPPRWQSLRDFSQFVDPIIENYSRDYKSPLNPENNKGRLKRINSTKSTLQSIIQNNFFGDISARNIVSIYENAIQDTNFEKLQHYKENPDDFLTEEEENRQKAELTRLENEKARLKGLIKAKEDEISARTKRSSVAKRAIEESEIPRWKEKIVLLDHRIEQTSKKLQYRSRDIPHIILELTKSNLFGQKTDITLFDSFENVFVAAIELIIENNGQKSTEYAVGEIDEMIIYLKSVISDEKIFRDTIMLSLYKVRETIDLNPDAVCMQCSQQLFKNIVDIL